MQKSILNQWKIPSKVTPFLWPVYCGALLLNGPCKKTKWTRHWPINNFHAGLTLSPLTFAFADWMMNESRCVLIGV